MEIFELFKEFISRFVYYTIEILPYFFVASVVGAFIQSFVSFNMVRGFVNKRFLSPLITAIFGSSVPVCSCSMIPVAQTINSFSRSYAPTLSFLIVAPVLSPVILFLMAGMFGWKLTVFRFVTVFVSALLTAYLVDIFFKKPPSLPLFSRKQKPSSRWYLFKDSFRDIFFNTGKYVLLGLFIASAVSTVIPEGFFSKFSQDLFSYVFIAVFSIPVYVCSGEEIPIGKSFVDLGLSEGQALTFMLASSGICIPTIIAVLRIFPKSVVFIYTMVWFLCSVMSGILYDLIF